MGAFLSNPDYDGDCPFLLHPKRRKAMEQKSGAMKKGAKVTAMGIVGTIDKIQDQTVIVKMVDGSKIEFVKAAITEVRAEEEAKPQEASS